VPVTSTQNALTQAINAPRDRRIDGHRPRRCWTGSLLRGGNVVSLVGRGQTTAHRDWVTCWRCDTRLRRPDFPAFGRLVDACRTRIAPWAATLTARSSCSRPGERASSMGAEYLGPDCR
jgi:hypothetical protein